VESGEPSVGKVRECDMKVGTSKVVALACVG
jgi:hypothetical protein